MRAQVANVISKTTKKFSGVIAEATLRSKEAPKPVEKKEDLLSKCKKVSPDDLHYWVNFLRHKTRDVKKL